MYVLDYLEQVWGDKYVSNFIVNTERTLKLISKYPAIYELIPNLADVRKAVLHKNCSFLYRVKNETIELLVFWDTRQEPFQ
ncbi:hypothetical protein MASR2M52_11170 [Pedobacter sp.]